MTLVPSWLVEVFVADGIGLPFIALLAEQGNGPFSDEREKEGEKGTVLERRLVQGQQKWATYLNLKHNNI